LLDFGRDDAVRRVVEWASHLGPVQAALR